MRPDEGPARAAQGRIPFPGHRTQAEIIAEEQAQRALQHWQKMRIGSGRG